MIGKIITPLTKEECKELRENIKKARLFAGFTQLSLGKALGVPHHSISRLELGSYDTDLESLVDICNVLQCDIDNIASKELYNKLAGIDGTPDTIEVIRAEEEMKPIMTDIPESLFLEVCSKGTSLCLHDIIVAGLKHFASLSKVEQDEFGFKYLNSKEYYKSIINNHLDNEEYDSAVKVISMMANI